ncbi:MAG: O-antigen ligase family protein [Nitrospirota bacterium]
MIFILVFANPIAKSVASIASSLCIIVFLLRVGIRKGSDYQKNAKTYYTIIFFYLAALAFSVVYSPDVADGIQRFFSQTKILLLLVLIEAVSSHVDARKYLFAGAAGGTALSLITIYESVIMHIGRPPAMWNPVHGGNHLMLAAVLVMVLLVYEKGRGARVFWSTLLLLHGYALYLNGTRGVWIAFGIVLVLLPLVVIKMRTMHKLIYYGILALFVTALLQAPFFQARVRGTISDLNQSVKVRTALSYGGRYEMWKASANMFTNNPLLGVGLGGWRVELETMVRDKYVSSYVLDYNQAHSIYLDVLSTRGIVGFISFAFLIGYPVIYVWKKRTVEYEPYRTLVLIATIAFLISGLTDTLVYIRGVFAAYLILVALSLGVIMRDHRSADADRTP